MAEVVVQDSARESRMRARASLLDSGQGRMGADAVDSFGNEFELKSTTRSSVSTGRDIGPHTIAKWRTRYWLVAYGRNLSEGFIDEEYYILHRDDMETWFRTIEGRFVADLEVWSDSRNVLRHAGIAESAINRIDYLINRGLTLNNPHIPMEYIRRHGTRVTENVASGVQKFVAERPLNIIR